MLVSAVAMDGSSQSLYRDQDQDEVTESDGSTIGEEVAHSHNDGDFQHEDDHPVNALDDFHDDDDLVDTRIEAKPPAAPSKRRSSAPDVVRMKLNSRKGGEGKGREEKGVEWKLSTNRPSKAQETGTDAFSS